ncbi:hypothetical protein B0H10DRAFT_2046184 [Mycena sp. CBHHK59/15]|nr:hypothetical protein B0H10DRAFT_2046184 [Mycena sp. CBHHK59/15]
MCSDRVEKKFGVRKVGASILAASWQGTNYHELAVSIMHTCRSNRNRPPECRKIICSCWVKKCRLGSIEH